VTVRRLADEVSWVLETRDAGGTAVSLDPPPIDAPLCPPVVAFGDAIATPVASGVHIGAHEDTAEARARAEVCDVEIRFVGPASVVALLRDVLDAYAVPDAPRWTVLERLLRHVITYWESTPRHPDPIFARDGWRCAVPICSSRRNLHDHHVLFRSRGGDNGRDNRVTICAAHHLHGIHAGRVRASGRAPDEISWELGVRGNGPPLLCLDGSRSLEAGAMTDA
jgi:hypothetical protein